MEAPDLELTPAELITIVSVLQDKIHRLEAAAAEWNAQDADVIRRRLEHLDQLAAKVSGIYNSRRKG